MWGETPLKVSFADFLGLENKSLWWWGICGGRGRRILELRFFWGFSHLGTGGC